MSYAEVGLVLAIPGFVGSALDPLIGVAGDTARRRILLIVGGVGFALSAAWSSAATGFVTLLLALVIGNPSTGAFVSLAQATLMDSAPEQRERNMARWTFAGSFGYLGGPVLVAAAVWLGIGWRIPLVLLGVCALPLTVAARRLPQPSAAPGSLRESFAATVRALRRREVIRWLVVLEAADLLLDVFHGFLALYLVDDVHVRVGIAALGVGVWTGAGLVGDWLLLLVLRRVGGMRYLRASAAAALVVYPAFLAVHGVAAKLVLVAALGLLNSGWYAIPKAGLYEALPGRSGAAIAVGGLGGILGAGVTLTLGFVASSAGLGPTMWILLLAPIALALGAPRQLSN